MKIENQILRDRGLFEPVQQSEVIQSAEDSSIADSAFLFLRESDKPQRDPSPEYPVLDVKKDSSIKISFLEDS